MELADALALMPDMPPMVGVDVVTPLTLPALRHKLPRDQECFYHAVEQAWGLPIAETRELIAKEVRDLDADQLEIHQVTLYQDLIDSPPLLHLLFTGSESDNPVLKIKQYQSYMRSDVGGYKSQAGLPEIRLLGLPQWIRRCRHLTVM